MTEQRPPTSSWRAWWRAHALLSPALRRGLWQWLAVSLLGRALQLLGVVSVMPFVALLSAPAMAEQHWLLLRLRSLLGAQDYAELLLALGLATIAIYALTALFTCFEVWFGARLSNAISHHIGCALFAHYVDRPYVEHLRADPSEMQVLVTEEAESAVVTVLVSGIEIVSNAVLVALVTATLMWVHWGAALSAAVLLSATYAVIHGLFEHRYEAHARQLHALGIDALGVVREALGGMREIKTHQCERRFIGQYRALSAQLAQHSTDHALLEFAPRQLLEAVAFSGIVVFALSAMRLHPQAGEIFPVIALFGLAAYRLIPALRELYADLESISYARFLIERVEQEFGAPPAAPPATARTPAARAPSPATTRAGEPLVELSEISFRYPGESTPVFEGLSLRIPRGQRLALVGPSGVGKSTAVDLIAGLLSPARGQIRVDGQPLTPERRRAWQSRIAYSSQQVHLFEDTLAENIALSTAARPLDSAQLQRAIDGAALRPLVDSLPLGVQTPLGAGQKLLSGGQLRRLGLARALYRAPELLILDESLNELDDLTQARVLDALATREGCTVLIITHDPRVIARCERSLRLHRAPLAATVAAGDERLAELSP